MRFALRVAYDGTRFAGSQVQPGVRTVHGELARALKAIDPGASTAFRWAGRTDAGVSARANVVALETEHPADTLLQALSFGMDDAWCWALAPVDAGFEPRHARERHYRYFLRTDSDAKALEDALRAFVGTHDFTAFCKLEPGVNPRRTLTGVGARREGPMVVIDVVGASFLWNQVRRMVEAARREAAGEIPTGRIAEVLRAGAPADLGTAAPEGLLLVDVVHDGLAWGPPQEKVLVRMRRHLEPVELSFTVGRAMLEEG